MASQKASRPKPVLVTGSHRSGSTWSGQVLATAPKTAYVHEPFNLGINVGVSQPVFQHWYQYISKHNEARFAPAVEQLIDFRYPLISNLGRVQAPNEAARIIKDQTRFLWHRWQKDTLIIKDPIAFFSAEWLAQTFDMRILVLIRHPAAFCASLKQRNWRFGYRQLLDQPELIDRYLQPFADDIVSHLGKNKDVIDQGILLWNIFHHTIIQYRQSHPDWLFVRHEDLSRQPLEEFKEICLALNLQFTSQVEQKIVESSGSHNRGAPVGGFARDSRANIHSWMQRLSQDEISKIRSETEQYASSFYADEDWRL